MAVPTFVAQSTSTATSLSITANYPAGVQAGDLLLAWYKAGDFQSGNGTATVTDPPGWTRVTSRTSAEGVVIGVWWHVVGASDTSVSFTASGQTTDLGSVVSFVAYRGADTNSPIDAFSAFGFSSTSSGSVVTMNSVTTTGPDRKVVYFWDGYSSLSVYTHVWAGATERVDFGFDPYYAQMRSIADLDMPTAGATGTVTCDPSNTETDRTWVTVAIKPLLNATVSGSDTGSGTDTANTTANVPQSDTGAGSDVATKVRVSGTADATGTVVDTATVSAVTPVADSGAGADTATTSAVVPATDAGGGTDTASVIAVVPASDSGSGADTALGVRTAASDGGAGADNQTVRVSGATDSGIGTDDAGLHTEFTATDTGAGADTAAVAVKATDSGTSIESAQASSIVPASDSGAGSDNAAVRVAAEPDTGTSVEDARANNAALADEDGTGTESPARVTIAVSDTAAGNDSANPVVASIPQTDSGTGTDDSTLKQAVTDAGTGSDTAGVRHVQSDSGTGTDFADNDPTGVAGEIAAGADNASVIIRGAVDSSAGADSAQIRFTTTDSGSAADTAIIAVHIFATDTAAGSDNAAIRTSVADDGSGTENAFKSISGILQAKRLTTVPAENRTIVVAREPRTIVAEPDNRWVRVRKDATVYA